MAVSPLARVWVLAESPSGNPLPATLELVGAARSLAEVVEVVAWGDDEAIAGAAATLGAYGATRLYSVGDPSPGLPGPRVSSGIASLVAAGEVPDMVLIGSSYDGRDVAGRLSAKLDRPVLTNVEGLRLVEVPGGETEVRAEHALFGGTQTATSRFTGPGPSIFVVRDKAFPASEVGGAVGAGAAQVVTVELGDLGRAGAARVVSRHVEERLGPELDSAEVVVSGGRGLCRPEAYSLVEELAGLLHGAPGASRAIVDAGWVPYSHQVGQTGKTVKPNVYIACGISGATQHMVGMKGARHVVAINTDPDAPILGMADLAVVGDCLSVLPKLIEELRARGGTAG